MVSAIEQPIAPHVPNCIASDSHCQDQEQQEQQQQQQQVCSPLTVLHKVRMLPPISAMPQGAPTGPAAVPGRGSKGLQNALQWRDVASSVLCFAAGDDAAADKTIGAVCRRWHDCWHDESLWRERLSAQWKREFVEPPAPFNSFRDACRASGQAWALGSPYVLHPAPSKTADPAAALSAAGQLRVTFAVRVTVSARMAITDSVTLLRAGGADGGEVALQLNGGKVALHIRSSDGGCGGVWRVGRQRVDDGKEHFVALTLEPRATPKKSASGRRWSIPDTTRQLNACVITDGVRDGSRELILVSSPGLESKDAVVECPVTETDAGGASPSSVTVSEASVWCGALSPAGALAVAHIGLPRGGTGIRC